MDINSLFSVKDKVVVITGGGSGIGLMISTAFVKNGAKVYITSRKAKVLETAAAELTKMGPGQCIALPCDLQNLDKTLELAQTIGRRSPTIPDKAWTKLLTLNVQRVFSGGPQADSPARIINIGSVDGLRVPALITPAYAASKAAVHHLTRVLAANLGGKHVTANAIAPGPFQSHMMAATLKNAQDAIVSRIPMGRIGRPEDMGAMCVFLASHGGSYINGTVIPVDGGAIIANQTYAHL
ncbi:NAD(P)-binding protein [Linderina pennispora]|uniref:NAD(P)-binding protein n=1 Tax=Linderina pennispora TaxID=61395 RepID=A0A1Y1W608_9FUNG|nr:NAD(P)-binding protein [Linderina pennispora]ORX68788.1 NAD(P)-binding protein [Linderina pennispora]